MTDEQRPHLNVLEKWVFALVCLGAGIAPLAARWIAGDVARIVYGLAITAVFLALTLIARKGSALGPFRELAFAFFVFAVVQVLNNSIPPWFGISVLHDAPIAGNPLASTAFGTVTIQLLETFLAVVPIIVLIRATGRDLVSVYARKGKLGGGIIVAVIFFVIFYALTATIPLHRLFQTNGTVTFSHLLVMTPALALAVLSNGFQEEFLFRGLFLQRYNTFFGVHVSNVLQALIFSIAHAGVTYTPISLVFLVVFVFPLGLFDGYLMRATNGVIAPAIFHAGADIPIYVAFLSFVS